MAARKSPAEGRKGDKFMRDALIVALHREATIKGGKKTKRLYQVAEALVKRAAEGDVAAAREIWDRVEGRPTQHIEANVTLFDKMTDAEQRSLAAALEALARNEGESADGSAPTHH